MSKALKPLIVTLLILSIVSLSLGVMLFSKREVLKVRTQRLEHSVAKIAEGVGFDSFSPEKLRNYETMQKQLSELPVMAQNQRDLIAQLEQDIDAKEQELTQAQVQLANSEDRIAELEPQLAALQDQVDEKDAELADVSTRMEEMDQEKSTLQVQIGDINNQLVRAEEEVRDMQDQLATLENTIARLEEDLGGKSTASTVRGLTGNIIVVNSDWNFVVIDRGNTDELEPGSEALVHRDDRLIGKVRVSNVKDQMSVADIVRDWEQLPIQEGDYVLF